jgi:hypothetical protein
VGFANQMHGVEWGGPAMVLGFAIIVFMMFGWLGQVVNESVSGILACIYCCLHHPTKALKVALHRITHQKRQQKTSLQKR